MSANAEDQAPVGGLLNRPSLRVVVADMAQDPVPDGNQIRTVKMSEVFKQVREEAGIAPFPQDSDVWDVAAHQSIFMTLTSDTNLITVNDDEPGIKCEGEFRQDALGNHKLTINGVEMAISGKGSSTTLVTGRRFQDALRFSDPGPLAGAKPEVTEHPVGMTATIGTTAAFYAKAINWDDVSLLKNGTLIPNTQGTAYQVAISFESKGAYQFKFSNRYGFTLSDPANINSTESDIPAVVSEPTDQTIDEGGSFSLPFIVAGPNLIFRVYRNNTLISTSSANVFTKTAAKTTDSGTYRIEAGNTLGQVVSNTVTVTVNAIILPIPVINFNQPTGMTVGAADQTMVATSTNTAIPIVFTTSDPSVAVIVSGNKLRVIAPGTVDITASQVGNNSYQAAVSVVRTVTMSAQPVAQITFVQPTNMTAGDADQALIASSTNTVTPILLTSSNANVATVVSGKLRIVSAGTVQVTATQAAGNGFQAAQPVSYTVVCSVPVASVISFTKPANMTVGDVDQALTATSTNNVTPIVFASSNAAVATIVNGSLHVVGAGSAVITASQAAGNGYLVATPVNFTVVVALQVATITFTQPTNMTVGDADQTLIAASNNTVTPIVFSTSDTSKATIVNGNKLHIVAAGTFTVYADQAAGNGFTAAAKVSRSVSITSGVAPTKVAIPITADSFGRNIGGTGVGSSASGSGPGILSITNQMMARLKQQVGTNVQFVVTDDRGNPGQTASWYATNENNNGKLQAIKDYISANLSAYDRFIPIAIYGANDEAQGGVNDTTSVDTTINNLYSANTQLKAISTKVQPMGYPITMRKDINMQPGTLAYRNAYNSRIYANPSIINANAVANYSNYPEMYSDSAPDDSRYFTVNDPDNLSKVHPTDLGYYRIAEMLAQQVAAMCGVTLTADGDPIIYQQPASQNLGSGQSLSLSVLAMGLNLTYAVKKGSATISGATSPNYTKSNATSADSGSYAFLVSNSIRTVTSNAAVVAVEAPPSVSLLSTLPTGLSYLAAITADGSGVNEVSTQGNFTAFSGRGTPVKVANAINSKAAYKFTGTNPDGFKLTLTNVQTTVMVAVTARIDNRDGGKESVILSLPFNQCGFNLCNNYPDRTISGVQNLEVGGPGLNAGLATGDLATFVFFTDGGVAKVRFKGVTYTASGNGSFATLQSVSNDFLVGGKTDASYPSLFDGIMGGLVIANGDVTEAKAIQVEQAMNAYYGL